MVKVWGSFLPFLAVQKGAALSAFTSDLRISNLVQHNSIWVKQQRLSTRLAATFTPPLPPPMSDNEEPKTAATNNVRWGILGAGSIAKDFAQAVEFTSGAELAAIASRSETIAKDFADEFDIPKCYGNYKDLMSDPEVDVIYIATIADNHVKLATQCLLHGKPTVVEKPLSLTYEESNTLIQLANAQQVFFMEGMWTRFFPATKKIRELIAEGAIGQPVVVSGDFGWDTRKCDGSHRFWFPTSGGAIYDIAMYMAQLGLAVFNGDSFHRTVAMGTTKQKYPQTGPVDLTTLVNCQFEKNRDCFLQFYVTGEANTEERAVIQGTNGRIVLDKHHVPTRFTLYREPTRDISDNDPEVFEFPLPDDSFTDWKHPGSIGFTYEIEEVGKALKNGEIDCKLYTWRETLVVSRMLESIREQVVGVNKERIAPGSEGMMRPSRGRSVVDRISRDNIATAGYRLGSPAEPAKFSSFSHGNIPDQRGLDGKGNFGRDGRDSFAPSNVRENFAPPRAHKKFTPPQRAAPGLDGPKRFVSSESRNMDGPGTGSTRFGPPGPKRGLESAAQLDALGLDGKGNFGPDGRDSVEPLPDAPRFGGLKTVFASPRRSLESAAQLDALGLDGKGNFSPDGRDSVTPPEGNIKQQSPRLYRQEGYRREETPGPDRLRPDGSSIPGAGKPGSEQPFVPADSGVANDQTFRDDIQPFVNVHKLGRPIIRGPPLQEVGQTAGPSSPAKIPSQEYKYKGDDMSNSNANEGMENPADREVVSQDTFSFKSRGGAYTVGANLRDDFRDKGPYQSKKKPYGGNQPMGPTYGAKKMVQARHVQSAIPSIRGDDRFDTIRNEGQTGRSTYTRQGRPTGQTKESNEALRRKGSAKIGGNLRDNFRESEMKHHKYLGKRPTDKMMGVDDEQRIGEFDPYFDNRKRGNGAGNYSGRDEMELDDYVE